MAGKHHRLKSNQDVSGIKFFCCSQPGMDNRFALHQNLQPGMHRKLGYLIDAQTAGELRGIGGILNAVLKLQIAHRRQRGRGRYCRPRRIGLWGFIIVLLGAIVRIRLRHRARRHGKEKKDEEYPVL
jgi:hypothetical protein